MRGPVWNMIVCDDVESRTYVIESSRHIWQVRLVDEAAMQPYLPTIELRMKSMLSYIFHIFYLCNELLFEFAVRI